MQRFFVAVATMVCLAGCFGSGPPTDGNNDIMVWDDCARQYGVLGIPADAASAQLPEGFEPVLTSDGQAQLMVLATRCGSIDGREEPLHDVLFAIQTQPPTQYTLEGAQQHGFLSAPIHSDHSSVAARYESWGVPSMTTSIAMEIATSPPGTGATVIDSLRLETALAGRVQTGDAGSVRLFHETTAGFIAAMDHSFPGHSKGLASATLEDSDGVSGFTDDRLTGSGTHAWGDDYAITLTPVSFA